MPFPRIDPNHPLTVAAREVNSQASREGLEAVLNSLEIGTGVGQLMYLAEQRALRAFYAAHGINLDVGVPVPIHLTEKERSLMPLLISAYMDGIAIGWRGHAIAEKRNK